MQKEVAHLLEAHVSSKLKVSQNLTIDQDRKLTALYWKNIIDETLKPNIATTDHLQTNGHLEWYIQTLNEILTSKAH